jgi:nucleotide-binding universal stress UspA family protein
MTAPSGTDPGRIVVGVDGSPASVTALRWAQRIAAPTGATIEAVIVWNYPPDYGWAVAGATAIDGWRPDLEAEKSLEIALDEAFLGHRPAGLAVSVRQGHARTVLLDAAVGAELLVVGSRGHGGFAGLLLGSVSAACAEHARCPVLVVHDDPA